jgi:hypothetical protein
MLAKSTLSINGIPSRRKLVRATGAALGVSLSALMFLGLSVICQRVFSSTDFVYSFLIPVPALSIILIFLIWPASILWERVLPSRTVVIPELTPWFRQSTVWGAIGTVVSATVAVLVFIISRL